MAWVAAPILASSPDQPQTCAIEITAYGPALSPPVLTDAFQPAPNLFAIGEAGGDTVGYASS